MTFKQFSHWCNKRASDGCWGILDALVCIDIYKEIKKHLFWKREKIWREKYHDQIMTEIINPIEQKISEMQAEYIKWCQTEEGKRYLVRGDLYHE